MQAFQTIAPLQQLTALGEQAWVMGRIEAAAESTLDADDRLRVILS